MRTLRARREQNRKAGRRGGNCFVAISTLLMAGCATEAGFRDRLATWMGSTIERVVEQFGYPNNELRAPGSGNPVYVYSLVDETSARSSSTPIGNTGVVVSRSRTTRNYCLVYFEAEEEGRIVNVRYEGNACRAPPAQ